MDLETGVHILSVEFLGDQEAFDNGRRAFRVFKNAVHRHHIEKDWYAFRDDALRDTARDWCEDHDLA